MLFSKRSITGQGLLCLFVFLSHRVMARHARPCSLHAALRALRAQAPRRPAPCQQVSTTPSKRGRRGGGTLPGGNEPRACPVRPGRAQHHHRSLCCFMATIRLCLEARKVRSGPQCLGHTSLPSCSSSQTFQTDRGHNAPKPHLPLSRKLAFHIPPARCTAAVTRTPNQLSQ